MNKAVATAVQDHLEAVKTKVHQTSESLQIPDFDTLFDAAGRLDTSQTPERDMFMIHSLLGSAASVGSVPPPKDYKLEFPRDHHFHSEMDVEWYWIACFLHVKDQQGNRGRISVLAVMEKFRSVGLQTQQAHGWTDEQAQIGSTVATITTDMDGKKNIYRRSPNNHWRLNGGDFGYSKPDETFAFHCGPDSLSGSQNVLPLHVIVDDGDAMKVDLTLTHRSEFETESAFFLQGMPNSQGSGTGLTPDPTPGLYYSWPQLVVQPGGSITVDGVAYEIEDGTGWIDHQVMMSSLLTLDGTPVTSIIGAQPFNGWVWQFFNFDDGEAFTGSAFIQGKMNKAPKFTYGYYLWPNPANKGWTAVFLDSGVVQLEDFQNFPSTVGDPASSPVAIPTRRKFEQLENSVDRHYKLSGEATPWFDNGTFNNPDGSLCSESPADYSGTSLTDKNPGKTIRGLGYLEAVGFEEVDTYRNHALSALQGK